MKKRSKLCILVADDEREKLKQLAELAELPVSSFLRRMFLQEHRRLFGQEPVVLRKKPARPVKAPKRLLAKVAQWEKQEAMKQQEDERQVIQMAKKGKGKGKGY